MDHGYPGEIIGSSGHGKYILPATAKQHQLTQ
jgi:hypothetical protein